MAVSPPSDAKPYHHGALRLLGRTRLRRLLKDLRDRIRPPRAAPDAGRANAPAMPELPAAGPAGWPLVPPVIPLPPAAGPAGRRGRGPGGVRTSAAW